MIAAALLALAMQAAPAPAAPAAELPPPGPALDCKPGYEALLTSIAVTRGVRRAPLPAPVPAASRFDTYFDDANTTIYFVTAPAMPAHPSIIRVKMGLTGEQLYMQPSGCTFGDPTQAPQLQQILDGVIKTIVEESE